MSLQKNQSGMLNPILILVLVLVVGIVGFAGYKVYEKNNKDDKNSTSSTTEVSKEVADLAQSECLKEFDDKDFCKFASSWSVSKTYKAVFTNKDAAGATSIMSIETEGDNSSSIISADGKETAAYIALNKVSYMKDYDANVWYKLPASGEATEAAADTNPTKDLDFNTPTTEEAKNTVSYKKIGKEACGNKTCFKYQVIDTADLETTENFIWFHEDDYKMARMTIKSKDGSYSDSVFTYPGNIKITEPSPVQDFPSFDPTTLGQ